VQAPDPATVQDFKQSIQKDQAATRQPISQADLGRLEAMGLADRIPPGTVLPPDGTPPPSPLVAGATAENQPPPQPDPVKEDKKKREYLSLFAPNVAFTYRRGQEGDELVGAQARASTVPSPAMHEPLPNTEDLELQVQQFRGQLPTVNRAPGQSNRDLLPNAQEVSLEQKAANGIVHNPDGSLPGAFNSSTGKHYVLFEGTVLETLLINRLNGTFSGPVNCLVTNDIYSHDGQHVLVPAGTKVLGEAKKVEAFGQQRLAVFFHRLIMPDGFSVTLDQFKGLNQIGETSLRDKVNNHYLQIFGASLAIGVLGGIAQAGTGNVYTNSTFDQARAGFGSSLANSSMQILDKFLNVLPTVTIREGNRVKVYLAGDLLLPDYSQHTMQPDI
jgi:type IV secretion system protein VirB10